MVLQNFRDILVDVHVPTKILDAIDNSGSKIIPVFAHREIEKDSLASCFVFDEKRVGRDATDFVIRNEWLKQKLCWQNDPGRTTCGLDNLFLLRILTLGLTCQYRTL